MRFCFPDDDIPSLLASNCDGSRAGVAKGISTDATRLAASVQRRRAGRMGSCKTPDTERRLMPAGDAAGRISATVDSAAVSLRLARLRTVADDQSSLGVSGMRGGKPRSQPAGPGDLRVKSEGQRVDQDHRRRRHSRL